ncbi:MAG TPA: hypothetical protein DD435_07450 [Cyanobacteria bacterium UBA8530]|nr:hypothetical protein [Cyanobacteria bacterium UBA8530]
MTEGRATKSSRDVTGSEDAATGSGDVAIGSVGVAIGSAGAGGPIGGEEGLGAVEATVPGGGVAEGT